MERLRISIIWDNELFAIIWNSKNVKKTRRLRSCLSDARTNVHDSIALVSSPSVRRLVPCFGATPGLQSRGLGADIFASENASERCEHSG